MPCEVEKMRALVLLTPAEGKRLIAKAVVQLEVVKKALNDGIVVIGTGTTNTFVAEEILGKKMDQSEFVRGVVATEGFAGSVGKTLSLIFVKGELKPELKAQDVYDKMGEDDFFIKGANALDVNGEVGIWIGCPDLGVGGMGGLLARGITTGITIVVPVGLEKLIPIPMLEASAECGRKRIQYNQSSRHPACGLFVVHGNKVVITEVDAVNVLSGATAVPVGAGGINGAEGAFLFVVKGDEAKVKKAVEIINSVKGEPLIKVKLAGSN
ncbi:MAG: hypothetical protein V1850_03475 [Candidatus Bathyarchaeota archaeon]